MQTKLAEQPVAFFYANKYNTCKRITICIYTLMYVITIMKTYTTGLRYLLSHVITCVLISHTEPLYYVCADWA